MYKKIPYGFRTFGGKIYTSRFTFSSGKHIGILPTFAGKFSDMRAVIQRVKNAAVHIGGTQKACIAHGMLILLGITQDDTEEDIDYLCRKISKLRIFDDENGVMNIDINEADGECIVVSQFTLYASTRKGNRPSYVRAAAPEISVPLYNRFVEQLQLQLKHPIQTGEFGADMQVELCNDGPVTICMDSKERE